MTDRVTAFQFQRQFGATFQRVRAGETLIINYDGVDSAAILPITEYRRLEGNMTEDPAPYLDETRSEPSARAIYRTLLQVHHGDAQAAARALLAHIQAEQAALALLLGSGGDADR